LKVNGLTWADQRHHHLILVTEEWQLEVEIGGADIDMAKGL